jgi:glyoxylase-like metal-dependent hydrolase (beta-lactamase superfamily II)
VIDTGHTDTDDTTALHIPSLGLLIAGDAIYNETHPFLVESDRAGRLAWLAAIDRLAAINPQAVIVGHGPLAPDCSPRHIDATRRYIRDFDRIDRETATARDLYDRMLALYPNRLERSLTYESHPVSRLRRFTDCSCIESSMTDGRRFPCSE